MTCYDGAVHNSLGDLIQPVYGEDGMGDAFIEKQTIETFGLNHKEFEHNYCVDVTDPAGGFLPGVLQVGIGGSSLELQSKLGGEYARLLLLTGTLLEGSAPLPESAERTLAGGGGGRGQGERAGWGGGGVDEAPTLVATRGNVFDEVEMDLGNLGSVRVGKKREDASIALRDRAAVAALKADILRRVKAISDSEDEEQPTQYVLVYDSENEGGAVKIAGGGEQSDSGSESGREGEGEPGNQKLR
ncbi:hypothetical protein DXG01_007832 [Tephrocybe rancida]|nr:hypothetical protein DXG01_007832 [Tephrocybe rancida]